MRIIDVDSGSILHEIYHGQVRVYAAAFGAGGKRVASACSDGKVCSALAQVLYVACNTLHMQ